MSSVELSDSVDFRAHIDGLAGGAKANERALRKLADGGRIRDAYAKEISRLASELERQNVPVGFQGVAVEQYAAFWLSMASRGTGEGGAP